MGDSRIREHVSRQSTGVRSSLAFSALILGCDHQPRPPPVLCTLAYCNSVAVKHYLPFHASLHTRSAATLSYTSGKRTALGNPEEKSPTIPALLKPASSALGLVTQVAVPEKSP